MCLAIGRRGATRNEEFVFSGGRVIVQEVQARDAILHRKSGASVGTYEKYTWNVPEAPAGKCRKTPAGKCRKRPPETAGNTCWKMLENAGKCVEVCARVEKHYVFDEKMGVLENAGKCRRHPLESAGKCRGRPLSENAGKACWKVPGSHRRHRIRMPGGDVSV